MAQKDADGSNAPYSGYNGRYRRTDQMLNFRWVYIKDTGKAALWWSNVGGRLSWVLGQAARVGSDSIWAYSASQRLSPDGVEGPWLVYSYLPALRRGVFCGDHGARRRRPSAVANSR